MMKLFLEFVSCCGCTKPSRSLHSSSSVLMGVEENEKTRGLVRKIRRYRRRRPRGSSGSVLAAEWNPSLRAISEDSVLTDELMAERKRRITRVDFRGSVNCRINSDGYRQSSYTAFSPEFSATPFMF